MEKEIEKKTTTATDLGSIVNINQMNVFHQDGMEDIHIPFVGLPDHIMPLTTAITREFGKCHILDVVQTLF